MAIIISNDGDVVVDNIPGRDAISKKIPGMSVTVSDASGDVSLGSGWAKYEWDEVNTRWMLISAEMKSELKFAKEKKVIENGVVTTNHVPADSVLWDARIVDFTTGVILGEVLPTVSGNSVDIEDLTLDGHYLEYSYAYGTMSTQLSQLLADFIASGGGGGSSSSLGEYTADDLVKSSEDDDVDGIITFNNVEDATSVNNGAVRVKGGISVVKNIYTTGVLTEGSDARLKEDVSEIEGSLEKVLKLKPVTYTKIKTQQKEIGFIANDVLLVEPTLVTVGSDKDKTLSLNYSRITALLTGAVKSLFNMFKQNQEELKRQRLEIDELKEIVAQLQK